MFPPSPPCSRNCSSPAATARRRRKGGARAAPSSCCRSTTPSTSLRVREHEMVWAAGLPHVQHSCHYVDKLGRCGGMARHAATACACWPKVMQGQQPLPSHAMCCRRAPCGRPLRRPRLLVPGGSLLTMVATNDRSGFVNHRNHCWGSGMRDRHPSPTCLLSICSAACAVPPALPAGGRGGQERCRAAQDCGCGPAAHGAH